MRLSCFLAGVLIASHVAAQDIYVDEGACPGEGCRYGERWIVTEPLDLRSAPDVTADHIGTIQPGQAVQTLTGEVHTIPGRFDVRRPHEEFVPGDEVLLYTYLGEGWFRLRHNGQLKEVDLNFSPWGGSGGKRCDNEKRCWGTLQQELEFNWWVKVRMDDGTEGWCLNMRTGVVHRHGD